MEYIGAPGMLYSSDKDVQQVARIGKARQRNLKILLVALTTSEWGEQTRRVELANSRNVPHWRAAKLHDVDRRVLSDDGNELRPVANRSRIIV